MKTETFTRTTIQLTNEEINALEKARQIVDDIYEIMHDEDGELLLCTPDIYGECHYQREDLFELEILLEALKRVQEII